MFTIFNGHLLCQGSINKQDTKFTNCRMFICYIEKNILSDYFHKMLITLYYIINLIVIEYTSCHDVFNLLYTLPPGKFKIYMTLGLTCKKKKSQWPLKPE